MFYNFRTSEQFKDIELLKIHNIYFFSSQLLSSFQKKIKSSNFLTSLKIFILRQQISIL